MHLNLSLYKDMLKNIPLGSAEDYQNFLNLTSPNYTTSNSQAPLSSTLTEPGTSPQKGFWRNWSFAARKSYKVNPPTRRARATHQTKRETCSVEMNHIFEPRSTGTTGTAGNGPRSNNGTTTAAPPSLPTSLVNENAQIGVDHSNLDEIRVVAADEENVP